MMRYREAADLAYSPKGHGHMQSRKSNTFADLTKVFSHFFMTFMIS